MDETDLLRSDEQWTHRQTTRALTTFGFGCLIIVEDVQQHAREQQHETARASLHTREPIRGRTREDREPQVTLRHAVIRLLRQHIGELLFLRIAGHRHHTLDLVSWE